MTTQLEDMLDAGEALITRIEGTRDSIEMELSELREQAGEIDNSIGELAFEADELHRKIAAVRQTTPHVHDPVAAATVQAIDNLIRLLTEAKGYFAAGNNLAAFGTLVLFDEHADDLKAAFRLRQMAQRRRPA